MLTVSGRNPSSRSYDAVGNTTQLDALTLIYGDHNRLSTVQQGAALVATYTYNGHGQRVAKTANGQTTVFHYDQSGQLIAETNPSGTLKREYYYLNGQLFMLFDRATNTQYRLHPDHLGTVRLVTRSTLTPVWRWDSAPFGETLPDEDPDGDGQPFVFNLRFPGQYFDQETGLHYNYFRDYVPSVGRYVESDPIGLAGGINTYTYVGGNPISYADPDGLTTLTINPGFAGGFGGTAGGLGAFGPGAAVAGAGLTGYGIGTLIYPYIALPLGDAIDQAFCPDEEECDPPASTLCWEFNYGHPHKGMDPHYHTWQMNKSPTGCRWNKKLSQKWTYDVPPIGRMPGQSHLNRLDIPIRF